MIEMADWTEVIATDVSTLNETRKSLHQAVQLVAAVPRNLLPPDPSDTSASLTWNTEFSCMESVSIGSDDIRIGLIFSELKLVVIKKSNPVSELMLVGKSVEEGLIWLRESLSSLDLNGSAVNLELPYEIEPYDYSAPLNCSKEALKALGALYGNTDNILRSVSEGENDVSEIRCWPHHFDLAMLLRLERDSNAETLRSIGIGLSPGDELIEEPYVYVNHWPHLEKEKLVNHPLIGGHWVTDGWTGATLCYQELLVQDQKELAFQFVEDVIKFLRNC